MVEEKTISYLFFLKIQTKQLEKTMLKRENVLASPLSCTAFAPFCLREASLFPGNFCSGNVTALWTAGHSLSASRHSLGREQVDETAEAQETLHTYRCIYICMCVVCTSRKQRSSSEKPGASKTPVLSLALRSPMVRQPLKVNQSIDQSIIFS